MAARVIRAGIFLFALLVACVTGVSLLARNFDVYFLTYDLALLWLILLGASAVLTWFLLDAFHRASVVKAEARLAIADKPEASALSNRSQAELLDIALGASPVEQRHEAVIAMEGKEELQQVLARCPELSLKMLAIKSLTDGEYRGGWIEARDFARDLVQRTSGHSIRFERDTFLSIIDHFENWELELAARLHPHREMAELIVEHTISLTPPLGDVVRDAFQDDAAAERAFARRLLPHFGMIYGQVFCPTFESRRILANRVAETWVPHPEFTSKTMMDGISECFGQLAKREGDFLEAAKKDNHPAVQLHLEGEIEKYEELRGYEVRPITRADMEEPGLETDVKQEPPGEEGIVIDTPSFWRPGSNW